jgi:hypothetical protein
MANIITCTNVFDFMGTPADIRTTNQTNVTSLITGTQMELEKMINRSVISVAFTTLIFRDKLNCTLFNENLNFKGVYADIYSLSSVIEEGVTLEAEAAFEDDHDYYLDTKNNRLCRNGAYWSTERSAIVMSGAYGYTDPATPANPRADIMLLITEMVAIKSGLWKTSFISADGQSVSTVKDSNYSTKLLKAIQSHSRVMGI